MFVGTWLLHAPAAPVREKRTLQLWACLNLHWTGSVYVWVLQMLESNCTHGATVQVLEQIVWCMQSFYVETYFHYVIGTRDSRSVTICPAELNRLCLYIQPLKVIRYFLPHPWHMCRLKAHVSRVLLANTWEKFSFKWLWLSSSTLCTVCSLLRISHCDQWKDS